MTAAPGNFFEVHQRRTYNLIERRDSRAALTYRWRMGERH